jgi:hypothetical protein
MAEIIATPFGHRPALRPPLEEVAVGRNPVKRVAITFQS